MKDTDAEEDIIEAFAVFDKDGTGHIKQEELLHIMSNLGETITKEETAEMMQDLGGESGMVNYRAFCRSMMEKTDVPREAIGHGSHGSSIITSLFKYMLSGRTLLKLIRRLYLSYLKYLLAKKKKHYILSDS